MKTILIFLTVIPLTYSTLQSQNTIKISGTITDIYTGEVLPNATIYNYTFSNGCTSNNHGYYYMNINSTIDSITFDISYIGYLTEQISLKTFKDTCLNIKLKPGLRLNEFEITAKKTNGISNKMGLHNLPIADILYTPVLLGEANLISLLKTLPGVSSGKEGASELYVRGGNYDQNLILLDEAPIYNLNHAFGLISVFNASTIKNVNLYKGGIPSVFGRRLSSVLDVTTRDGNKKRFAGGIDFSTLSGALYLEGPIVKEKVSFLFSARRSWIDKLASPLINSSDQKMKLYFYDINGKINWVINNKNKLYLSYYKGQDEFDVQLKDPSSKSIMEQGWGNHLGSLRWNTILNSGAFIQLTGYFTKFSEFNNNSGKYYNSYSKEESYSTLLETGIKGSANWPLGQKSSIKTGFDLLHNTINPPIKKSIQDSVISNITSQHDVNFNSYGVYSEYFYNSRKFFLKVGLRTDLFSGSDKNYIYVQPRLNATYQLSKALMAKCSSMRNVQPFYVIKKNNNGFPAYAWLPLVNNLNPQESWQISIGINWAKKFWMLDIESYYKTIKNQFSNYRYPYDIYSSYNWVDLIDKGKGRAYGIEILNTIKNKGWNIRTSYTLAKSEFSSTDIAYGKWIPSDYDIRHDASMIITKDIKNQKNKRNWFAANFTFHSGIPFSLPTLSYSSKANILNNVDYDFKSSDIDYYSYPNNYRLKAYHRLDLSYNIQLNKKNGSRTWSIGIINTYNRKNQYIIYRANNNNFKQLTLFPIMPFISFKKQF
ncbi:TonB-dependent receptor [Plebeiibacterium sediminum]|uniref:TonB-dependent receptor n=1 Tax=Plebeiibacterium sediminum TaxID=2992112 RepID=A0AAE3SH47_9BACT|nr:TonB-dependent receptor [Plebeiobacterium sediminum]MCW3788807.1 TonB-dependent receptor [Plebeiobacterium sediminum]